MRTDRPGLARELVSLVVLSLLVACGGGGGGGSGGSSSGSVVYTGNTNPAVVSAANASQLTANVIGSGDAAGIIGGISIENGDATQNRGSGVLALALRLNRTVHDTLVRAQQASSTQRAVTGLIQIEQTDPCDSGSGSMRTFGTLSDSGTGTLQVSFNNCLSEGVVLSGAATLLVDAAHVTFSVVPTDFTLSFSRLTLRGPGVSVDAGGSLHTQLGNGNADNRETITADLVSQNNNTGETSKTENLVFVNVYDNIFSPSSFTANVSGKIFDHVHGYVDITTVAPLVFGTMAQLFPNSGQMLLTGAGNRSIRATAFSVTLTRLELDLDGDGVVDNVATLQWTDLSGPIGSDLRDSDGDGMHNSWEVAKDLNPNDAADAALDSDGDGFSILQEYQAGTDPNNASSTPPIVGISISLSDSPDPVIMGSNLTYTITVLNSSSPAATNVVVIDTLPAGVELVSATPGQGSCSGTSLVTCSLGTLNGFGNVVIAIVVTPTAAGVVSNTASVTSSSIDLDMTNNSAATTTTVWQVVAGTIIDLPSNSDLIFDAVTQRIYASVRGNAGSVTPIDPVTGIVGTAIPVGIDPVKLARSDNGQYLYVGLDGENAVQRINLSTQTVNLTFSLNSDPLSASLFVEDMEVLPGSPQSIAVSRRFKGLSPKHAGVAIFDDNVQRVSTTPGHTGANAIEFSASAGTLYGYNNETTEFGFRRMAVTPSGVSELDVFTSFMGDLISGGGVDIKFHAGLIYTTNGRVIDPVARTVLGTFFVESLGFAFVVPDATTGRAFFLTSFSPSGPWSIRAFDLNTRQLLGSVIVSGVTGVAGSLIRWGAKGLAFRTSTGQIHLIESSALIP